MKITGIDLHTVPVNDRVSWTFVLVNTDEGICGLGELNPSGLQRGCGPILERMADTLIGKDPCLVEALVQSLNPQELDYAGVLSLSALDQALWDLLGKVLSVPLYQILGGRCHEDIHVYANINRATVDRTPRGFAENAEKAVSQGFDAIKLAPFDGLNSGLEDTDDAKQGLTCMREVRQAIGPDVKLLIDCHSHFTVRGALRVADALRELDLYWFEEPIPFGNIEGYRQIRQQIGVPLAGAESRQLRQGFWDVLVHEMMDVVMPDVTIVGGISELRKVADMAQSRGVPTAPHGPFGPVALAAGIQTMMAHPGFQILEYAWGEVPWREDLITPAEEIRNGRIKPSRLPGLGVELNMKTLRSLTP